METKSPETTMCAHPYIGTTQEKYIITLFCEECGEALHEYSTLYMLNDDEPYRDIIEQHIEMCGGVTCL